MSVLGALLQDLTSGDSELAEAAALALPDHGDTALNELSKLLQSSDPEDRWWAARSLAGFDSEGAGAMLTGLLTDADASVRHCAALALSKRPHAKAIPELITALGSTDHLFARLAGDALISLGKDAVEQLIAALDSLPQNGKVEATRALALIGDTRAIGPLFKLLENDSVALEHWVSEGREKMGVGMRFFEPK